MYLQLFSRQFYSGANRKMTSVSSGSGYADAIELLNGLQTRFPILDKNRLQNRSLTWEERKVELTKGPDMMRSCLDAVGIKLADLDARNIIHVAGSNGKGSTCAYIQHLLLWYQRRHGRPNTIGMYTSPHLVSVRERIKIDGMPLSSEEFAKYLFEVHEKLIAAQQPMPGYFRFLTLLAFYVFVKKGVTVAVLETGVGGEYDTTNVVPSPVVSVITSISKDHQMVLGHTLEQIAWHKGGIIKTNSQAFSADQRPEVLHVLENRALEKGVKLQRIGLDERLAELSLPEKQSQNCSVALAATDAFVCSHLQLPALPNEAIGTLGSVKWPGRFQIVEEDDISWCLDGAHNEDGLTAATTWFKQLVPSDRQSSTIMIFNQDSQRDTALLLEKVHTTLGADIVFDQVIFSTNDVSDDDITANPDTADYNKNRDRDFLSVQYSNAKLWKHFDEASKVIVTPNITQAVTTVRQRQDQKHVYVLVTGSLRLVGGFLRHFASDCD